MTLKFSKFFLILSLFMFILALIVFYQDIPWLADKISIVTFACYAIAILALSLRTIFTEKHPQ